MNCVSLPAFEVGEIAYQALSAVHMKEEIHNFAIYRKLDVTSVGFLYPRTHLGYGVRESHMAHLM